MAAARSLKSVDLPSSQAILYDIPIDYSSVINPGLSEIFSRASVKYCEVHPPASNTPVRRCAAEWKDFPVDLLYC